METSSGFNPFDDKGHELSHLLNKLDALSSNREEKYTSVLHFGSPDSISFQAVPDKKIDVRKNDRGPGYITWQGVGRGKPPRRVEISGVDENSVDATAGFYVDGTIPPAGPVRVIPEAQRIDKLNEQLIIRNELAISRLRASGAHVTFTSTNEEDFKDIPDGQLEVSGVGNAKMYYVTVSPDQFPPATSKLWNASKNMYGKRDISPQVDWRDGINVPDRLDWFNGAMRNRKRTISSLELQDPTLEVTSSSGLSKSDMPFSFFYKTKDGRICILMYPEQKIPSDISGTGTTTTQLIDINTGEVLANLEGTYITRYHSDDWSGAHEGDSSYNFGDYSTNFKFTPPPELGLEVAPLSTYAPSLTTDTALAASAEHMLKVYRWEDAITNQTGDFDTKAVVDTVREEKRLIDEIQKKEPTQNIYDPSIPHLTSVMDRALEAYQQVDIPRFYNILLKTEGQNTIDAQTILHAFNPLTTQAEQAAFIQKVRAAMEKDPKVTDIQHQRITWLQQKLSEVQETGEGRTPELMTYEIDGNGNFFPVFNADSEFKMGAAEFTHIPTGLKGKWTPRVDYPTGRVIFSFNQEGYPTGQPIAEYAVQLRRDQQPAVFTASADHYRVYRYKYNTANVAEDSNGNPVAVWSETKKRWIAGKPREGWSPSNEMTNLDLNINHGQKSMAQFQGLLTGTPSEILTSMNLPEPLTSETDPNRRNADYALSAYFAKEQTDKLAAEKVAAQERITRQQAQQETLRQEQALRQEQQNAQVEQLIQPVKPRMDGIKSTIGQIEEITANYPIDSLPVKVQHLLRQWQEFDANVGKGTINTHNLEEVITGMEQQLTHINPRLLKDYITTTSMRNRGIYARIEINNGQVVEIDRYGDKKPVQLVEIGRSGRTLNISKGRAGEIVFRPSGNWGQEFALPSGSYAIGRDAYYGYSVTFNDKGEIQEILGKPIGQLIDEDEQERLARQEREEQMRLVQERSQTTINYSSSEKDQEESSMAAAFTRAGGVQEKQTEEQKLAKELLIQEDKRQPARDEQPQVQTTMLAGIEARDTADLVQEVEGLMQRNSKPRKRALIQAALIGRGPEAFTQAKIPESEFPVIFQQLKQARQEALNGSHVEAQAELDQTIRKTEQMYAVLKASHSDLVTGYIGQQDDEELRKFQSTLLALLEGREKMPKEAEMEQLIEEALDKMTA